MSKQKKYRGLTKEGNLIYGWLIEFEDMSIIFEDSVLITKCSFKPYSFIASDFWVEVIPESVRQSIGRWDSDNNKEIFHKDIVEIRLKNGHKRVGIVEWVEKECGYIINVFKATDGETGAHSIGYSGSAVLGIKVIGNNLQHPNLLK